MEEANVPAVCRFFDFFFHVVDSLQMFILPAYHQVVRVNTPLSTLLLINLVTVSLDNNVCNIFDEKKQFFKWRRCFGVKKENKVPQTDSSKTKVTIR